MFGEGHAYLATIHYALGEIAKFRGDIDASIERYGKALDIYLKAYGPDHPYTGTAYYAIAFAHESRGEFEKAVTSYERARRIYAAAYGDRHPHVAVACHGLGNVHNAMGEFEKAISYFDKAIGIYLAVFGENHINTAASLIGLGNAYRATGNLAAALPCFERALAIHRAVLGEAHPETGQSYFGIGMARASAGDFDDALRMYGRAREIFTASLGDSHPSVANVLLQVGRVFYSRNNPVKAKDQMEKALALYREKSLHTQIIAASNMLGIVYLDGGDPLRARPYFEGSIAEIEKERFEAGADRTEFMRRYINSYYYSLKSSAMANDIESVFGTAESMRARGFLDRMTLASALSAEGVGKADRERLIGLNDAIEALASRRSAEVRKPTASQDGAALVSIAASLEQREKEFRELDARLMKNEKYRNLRKPHIATLAEARNACGKDTAILEYVIWEEKDSDSDAFTHRQSYCIVITEKGQALVALDKDFDYSGAVGKFRDTIIGHKTAAEQDAAGIPLYGKLIAPVAKEIAGVQNIIIVPDGALAFLPFDALRETGGGPYLCESRSVTMSPSVSVMLMVKKRRFSADRRQFLAFGGAAYAPSGGTQRGARRAPQKQRATVQSKEYYAGEGDRGRARYYRNLGMEWDNIPGTLDEVKEIDRAVYRREGTRVITGAAVSESKLKELSRRNVLARYRSVHFACHGYYDADMPSYSAVVMSEVSGTMKSKEDGYLSVPEVALMKLQADIVNLSACETGLGAIVQGDGVVGLARAFQEAGANRVGVTLWEVADEPTKEFMVGVYRKSIQGKASFGAAVTSTKREFIRSRAYSDPYFWSGFVLYGR